MFKYSMLAICCVFPLAHATSTANNELMNKKQLEISKLNQYISIGRGNNYQDSVDIGQASSLHTCSNIVKRTETRQADCDVGTGKMTQSRQIYGTNVHSTDDSYNCENSPDGRTTDWVTIDNSSCRVLPVCSYETTKVETINCPEGKTGTIDVTYKITSKFLGNRVETPVCYSDVKKTEISRTESCQDLAPKKSCEIKARNLDHNTTCEQYIGLGSATRDPKSWVGINVGGTYIGVFMPNSEDLGKILVENRINMIKKHGDNFFNQNGFIPMAFGTGNGQVLCFVRNNDAWNNGDGFWRHNPTDVQNEDSDGDGFTDSFENYYGMDVFVKESNYTPKQETVDKAQARGYTSINSIASLARDDDADGLVNGLEIELGLNPLNKRTNGTVGDGDAIFRASFDSNCENKEYNLPTYGNNHIPYKPIISEPKLGEPKSIEEPRNPSTGDVDYIVSKEDNYQ